MRKQASMAGRIPELDALRGLSALAVLVTHLPRGFWFGETAVDLFFVLSGYLITSIIIKNRHKDRFLLTFYVRRSLRIWPIYYLALGLVVLANMLRRSPDPLDALPYYLAYLQNIHHYWGGVGPPMDNVLGHTWTLAIEEQFYLIWPPLLMLVGRRYLTPLSLFFVVLPAVLRGFGLSRVVLFGHCDGLALGALLASLKADAPLPASPRESRFYLAACAVLAALYGARCGFLLTNGYTGKQIIADNVATILISLVYFALIGFTVCSAGRSGLRLLRVPALVYLGQISYGLYLYHWIVYGYIDLVIKFGMGYQDPWWLDVLKVAASFAVAVFSWHFIEQPILALKDRWTYSRSPWGGRGSDVISLDVGRASVRTEGDTPIEALHRADGRTVQELR